MSLDPFSAEAAPRINPQAYPGAWWPTSALISSHTISAVDSSIVERLVEGKIPLIALGSNSSPSQLRHKFLGKSFEILTLVATIPSEVGYARFLSPYGAIPASPVLGAGEAIVRCQFVDREELAILDATELPYYERRQITAWVEYLGTVEAEVYVATGGALEHSSGDPVLLAPIHEHGMDQKTALEHFGERLPRVGRDPIPWLAL